MGQGAERERIVREVAWITVDENAGFDELYSWARARQRYAVERNGDRLLAAKLDDQRHRRAAVGHASVRVDRVRRPEWAALQPAIGECDISKRRRPPPV